MLANAFLVFLKLIYNWFVFETFIKGFTVFYLLINIYHVKYILILSQFKECLYLLFGGLIYQEGIFVVNASKNFLKFDRIPNLEIEMVNPDAFNLSNHVCETPHPGNDLLFIELSHEILFITIISINKVAICLENRQFKLSIFLLPHRLNWVCCQKCLMMILAFDVVDHFNDMIHVELSKLFLEFYVLVLREFLVIIEAFWKR